MKVSAKNKKAQLSDDTSYPHHAAANNTACSGCVRVCAIYKHSAYAWLQVFSALKQYPRPPKVNANCWVLGEMERNNGDSE